jgi:N-acetylglucosamine-6-sulfatase
LNRGLLVALTAISLGLSGAAPVSAADARPNFVIMLIDDFPAMDNRVFERLPAIKATFLDQGVSFTNDWTVFSLCCPGRAALWTGLRNDHNGVMKNSAALFDPRVTIATELQGVGYHTIASGKYLNGTTGKIVNELQGWSTYAFKREPPYFGYSVWVNDGTAKHKEVHGYTAADYSTDVMADHAIELLRDAPADKPLFIYDAPNATHGGTDESDVKDGKQPVVAERHRDDPRCGGIAPYRPASYNEADVSDKPAYVRKMPLYKEASYPAGWPLQKACEALLSVDDWLGRTIAVLKSQGRYENTVFILTADNGMGWGAHRLAAKIAPYSAQVPLFVSWPALTGATFVENDTLLWNVDVAPTLCALAGCEMGPYLNYEGPVDGSSFAGLFAPIYAAPAAARDSIIIEGLGGGVPWFKALMTSADHARGQWLYVRYPATGEEELYDVSGGQCIDWQVGDPGDPCMLDNVVAQKASLRTALLRELKYEWTHGSH